MATQPFWRSLHLTVVRNGHATPSTLSSQLSLVARVLSGDPAAERELYDTHVDRVFRLAYRITGDPELAQDVTQETFIRAFRQLGSFRGQAALSTWLHSIAVSVALNGVRRARRTALRESPLDDAPSHALTSAPSSRHAEPDLRMRLHEAIAALPPGYRTVFLMHDVEGYTHQEIGAALGVEAGTSKAQLSRARAKLREALRPFRDHPPDAGRMPDSRAAPMLVTPDRGS